MSTSFWSPHNGAKLFLFFSIIKLLVISSSAELDPLVELRADPAHSGIVTNQAEGSLIKQEGLAGSINRKYVVIVDCGSSGSRAHIFSMQLATNASAQNYDELISSTRPLLDSTTGEPVTMKIKPGLSSVRDQPAVASDYMKPLMDFVSSKLPAEVRRETPVYFMATAGLRLLDKEEQELILEDIAKDYRVLYDFADIKTSVISGGQEGAYQWISTNAIAGRLNSHYDLFKNDFFCQAPLARRYAVIEMGGASTQVTYEVNPKLDYMIRSSLKTDPEALKAYQASLVSVPLGATRTFSLFSATFLGLGSNSAREAATNLLVRDYSAKTSRFDWHNSLSAFMNTLSGFVPSSFGWTKNSDLILDDPCLPVGGEETVQKPVELLWNQQVTIGSISRPKEDSVFNVKLIGRGNYPLCQRLVNRLILIARQERMNCQEHHDVYSQNDCSTSLIGTPFIPFKHLQFLGLADFYFTTNEMIKAAGIFNGPLVQKRAAQMCSTPLDVLSSLYPEANRIDKTRTMFECFKSSWILGWLYTGLGLRIKFDRNLETVEQVNGQKLDWTLGAAIEKLSEKQY